LGFLKGRVIKLDRGFPLVKAEDGWVFRCEHATSLKKSDEARAVIGDMVEIGSPETHDKGIIQEILPRSCRLVRKDPTERTLPQVLAANFDIVLVAEPIDGLNLKRLERELVLAHETGARVAVVLTKADLAESSDVAKQVRERACELAGDDTPVLVISSQDFASIEEVRALIGAGNMAVLIGKSGVGKSSLVNLLAGSEVRAVGEVREGDGKGRHTTVSRAIVELPGGSSIVDMPGIRGLGLWDAEAGIEAAFADVEEFARQCRFRDCRHKDEPGCAVRAAVEAGELSQKRFDSYQALKQESAAVGERREEARRMRGEKASDVRRKRAKGGNAAGKASGGGSGRAKGGKGATKPKGAKSSKGSHGKIQR
jgi:ribosome biogenesis GTPase / thiamine phosphate phosphatase